MKKLLVFFLLVIVVIAGMVYIGVMPDTFYSFVEAHLPASVASAVTDALDGVVAVRGESTAPVIADAEAVPAESPRRPEADHTQIIDAVINGVLERQEGIVIPVAFPDGDDDSVTEYFLRQVEFAVDAMRREMPEIFWLSLGSYNIEWNGNRETREGSLTVHLRYCHGEEEILELQKVMDMMADYLVEQAPADPVSAVEFFHDWIVENASYASALADMDSSMQGYEYGFNIDGIFMHGSAVCEGYTKAFKLLCDRAGIPCRIVFGVAGGENHSWNYVMIDESWYLVDVTWDDPVGPGDILLWDYCLKGRESTVDGQKISETYREDYADYPLLNWHGYYETAG